MKIKPNDKCSCGSNLKYKKCCSVKKQLQQKMIDTMCTEGHAVNSSDVQKAVDMLKEMLPKHKIIDVSGYLATYTYEQFQIYNFRNKTVMIAERCETSEDVFKQRAPDSSSMNMMILYKGAYRVFESEKTASYLDSVCSMIEEQDRKQQSIKFTNNR